MPPPCPHPAAPIESSTSGIGGGAIVPVISWLRARRGPRYLILLLCSPILLPFLCFTFPLICVAEFCIRACRRNRLKAGDEGAERLRRCEEGGAGAEAVDGEFRLLQRYLEDQLTLVRSVYECGDGHDDGGFRDFDYFASGERPLLS